jgi:hypothetical protein
MYPTENSGEGRSYKVYFTGKHEAEDVFLVNQSIENAKLNSINLRQYLLLATTAKSRSYDLYAHNCILYANTLFTNTYEYIHSVDGKKNTPENVLPFYFAHERTLQKIGGPNC